MKTNYLLPLLVLVILSGCTDTWYVERQEDKLIGVWEFDQAFYRENGDIFRDRIDRSFEGDILEIYPDYTSLYDDFSRREVYPGDWEFFIERDFYDDENDRECFLDLVFYDRNDRVAWSWYGEVTLLTREKLNLRVNDRAGTYIFKLRRRR
ncbi:MAG: hypothetical protein H6555_00805 [Lewinellaceae bacterium]|nr:hypothetical protein [Lewinellaceae bacterium]